MRGILSLLCVALCVHTGISQTNSFPLYSSGTYSGGSSSDLTDVASAQLKLNATSGYIRVPHLSASSTVSTVYNYQTGKHVYWGEPSDAGQYIFRGRNVVVENSSMGLGISTPSQRLDVLGRVKFRSTSGASAGAWFTDENGTESAFVGKLDGTAGSPLGIYHGGAWRLAVNENGHVGIGTNSPGGKLEINYAGGQLKLTGGTVAGGVWTSASDVLYLADWQTGSKGLAINMTSGNVGIGTASPGLPLHIKASADAGLYLDLTGGSKYYIASQSGNYLQFGLSGGGASQSFVLKNGDVGIGTTTPDAKLSVKGQVHAQEVKVDLNGAVAPDYVFNKDYKLPSLEEIKSYIEKNNHLPEVPSAKEMEENGMNLGEMNLLLLKKVEELTLYLIRQEQKVQGLVKENQRQANDLAQQQNSIMELQRRKSN